MAQQFKAVYFTDYREFFPQSKCLTLAFSEKDSLLFDRLRHLSSQEIRELLGVDSYSALLTRAKGEDLPINSYCQRLLKQKILVTDNPAKTGTDTGIININPSFATFHAGREDPLQSWYSYLEGYSPRYVSYIIEEFAPNANIIYDPFSGIGTTPITGAELGLLSYYSEINPVLQFITDAKISARNTSGKDRERLISNLEGLEATIEQDICSSTRDSLLEQAYTHTFDRSQFFDEKTFDQVLRARTFVDEINNTVPLAARLLTVAIINSLIPASLLQRAGDIRYKRPKELAKKADFLGQVKKNLVQIRNDMLSVKPLPSSPVLITEDAKHLNKLPRLDIDTVITSPPYLNGTNYFRNTKVELWFMRSLRSKSELSLYRRRAITSGINDVSVRTPIEFITDETNETIERLQEVAYDNRIPMMVANYFQDMAAVFSALRTHLKGGATIAIDIGDSIYAGVHVKTDELLKGVLAELGYRFGKEITLRKRLSRNREVLKQALLIFSHPKSRRSKKAPAMTWSQDWESFKSELPHQDHPFSKRNWGNSLHSLCSYQGKMKPSLAHHLVKTFVPHDGAILDIFAGVGTIPFEAALNGMTSFGFEISPAAYYIANAKVSIQTLEEVIPVMERLGRYLENTRLPAGEIEKHGEFGFNSKLKDYFDPDTFREILLARNYFLENPPITSPEYLVISCLLHILHGNRPYALSRRSHPITPFSPRGEYIYKPLLQYLNNKVTRSLQVERPQGFKEGKIYLQDTTSWWPQEIDNLDAIITSPPFFDSTRFYLSNWMRLWFCGWNGDDFQSKPHAFVDERQKASFDIYEPVFRQARERLRKGGVFVLHLGKSKKCDMADELLQISRRWFRTCDIYAENVEHCESHGIRDKGTVNCHQYLVLS